MQRGMEGIVHTNWEVRDSLPSKMHDAASHVSPPLLSVLSQVPITIKVGKELRFHCYLPIVAC